MQTHVQANKKYFYLSHKALLLPDLNLVDVKDFPSIFRCNVNTIYSIG